MMPSSFYWVQSSPAVSLKYELFAELQYTWAEDPQVKVLPPSSESPKRGAHVASASDLTIIQPGLERSSLPIPSLPSCVILRILSHSVA